ncbi:MAG: glycosyltransferase family 2 protein [Thermodesulfobacteriota bacterium]|nr:MAG: glycosyltransferase family 2 protein [Thermodesulfobacteriota bacterium]
MKLFKGKISVIMPAYNEGHHIYQNIKETHRVFKKSKCGFEVILVDDGSVDDTYAEAEKAARDLSGTIPVNIARNRGKGNALKEGFLRSTGDLILFLDADLDLHPEQLSSVFRIMRDEKADVIVGSKYHPQSDIHYPFSRKVLSKTYASILKVLFDLPLRDTQTGMKVFRREVLDEVFPLVMCKGFAFDIELLTNAHNMGYKVVEAPVTLHNRREMQWGRITVKDMYRMWLDTMGIYYRVNRNQRKKARAEANRLKSKRGYGGI